MEAVRDMWTYGICYLSLVVLSVGINFRFLLIIGYGTYNAKNLEETRSKNVVLGLATSR